MTRLDERPAEERREFVRRSVKAYPCVTALDQEQLEAAIDRILEQSHPDNLGRREGRKPRHDLATALFFAADLSDKKEELDVRLESAMDQANLLTKGYLEVSDDYWANRAEIAAETKEAWKNMRLHADEGGAAIEAAGGEGAQEAGQGQEEDGEGATQGGAQEAGQGQGEEDLHHKVYQRYAEEEEGGEQQQEEEDYDDEEEVQRRMWVKVKLSTFPEAEALEPHELEAAIDRILNPVPAHDNSTRTRMTYADINLVLAYKRRKDLVDDNIMHPEEFQAMVRRDLITRGYVEVDKEYWAKMEPCFARSHPGIYNSSDTQNEEEYNNDGPVDLEKHEDDDSLEQQQDEDNDPLEQGQEQDDDPIKSM